MTLFDRLFSKPITRRVNAAVKAASFSAPRALDDLRDRAVLRSGLESGRDRLGYERDQVLAEALLAWRANPLARRIVGMMTQYVVGGGIGLECDHPETGAFLRTWWSHPLNRLPVRVYEWCDELTRAGELFILVSTDPAGMSYLRALPAAGVAQIVTAENDLEQELFVVEKPGIAPGASAPGAFAADAGDPASTWLEGRRWAVYNLEADRRDENGNSTPAVLHFAVNRPVGARFGESDLAPLLRWLARYAAWLEDRARLNRFRNTFLFWVKARFASQAEKLQRQADLNRDPPSPGSILVTDESESWSVLSPNLASFEAAEDGLALKKMIAAGAGLPLHFLAEPESATRTTAESAGGPTFRHFQQRQVFFLCMLEELARAAVHRRSLVDARVNPGAKITAAGADISTRDNAELAEAAAKVIPAFSGLHERGLIDGAELLRLAYRFAGEVVDVNALLARTVKG
jgi:hypothetical protein